MSPLPPVPLDAAGPAGDTLRALASSRGRVATFHQLFSNSPPVMGAIWDLVQALWNSQFLTRRQVELIILRVSQLVDAEYEWVHHVPMARTAGLNDSEIAATSRWWTATEFDDVERAILRATDEVVAERMAGADTMAELGRHLDAAAVLEVLTTAGLYALIAGVLRSADARFEDWAPLDDPLPFPGRSAPAPPSA